MNNPADTPKPPSTTLDDAAEAYQQVQHHGAVFLITLNEQRKVQQEMKERHDHLLKMGIYPYATSRRHK